MGDPSVWRKTLRQAAAITVVTVTLSAVGPWAGPGLMRLVTRTPDPLLAACETLGAKPQQAGLTGWVEIKLPASDQMASPPGMNALAAQAVSALAGEPAAEAAAVTVETAEPDGSLVERTFAAEGVVYRARCRRVGRGDETTLYLVCEVDLEQPRAGDLMRLRKHMVSALNTLGRGSRRPEPVYVTVRAILPELLDQPRMDAAAKQVSARLHGRMVDTMAQDTFFSVLIHATVLGAAVNVGGQAVNLGLVLIPDPESGCTRIILGTPLCAGDY